MGVEIIQKARLNTSMSCFWKQDITCGNWRYDSITFRGDLVGLYEGYRIQANFCQIYLRPCQTCWRGYRTRNERARLFSMGGQTIADTISASSRRTLRCNWFVKTACYMRNLYYTFHYWLFHPCTKWLQMITLFKKLHRSIIRWVWSFFRDVFTFYGQEFDHWVLCMIEGNAAVNKRISILCLRAMVESFSHKLILDVNEMLSRNKSLYQLVDYVHQTMKIARSLKSAPVLRNLTGFTPTVPNDRRWSVKH